MKLSRTELVAVILLIAYVAFFTHPPPAFVKILLSSPVGHIIALLGVLYVTVRQSLVVGVFMGIAYLMTGTGVTEYYTEPKPAEEKPDIAAMLKSLQSKDKLEKGDTVAHKAVAGKSETAPPPSKSIPDPSPPKKLGAVSTV